MDNDTIVNFYRDENAKFIPLFNQLLDLVYCRDIKEVLLKLGVNEYDPNSCSIFLDSCKLAWNPFFFTIPTNILPSLNLTTLKEKYESIKDAMKQIKHMITTGCFVWVKNSKFSTKSTVWIRKISMYFSAYETIEIRANIKLSRP